MLLSHIPFLISMTIISIFIIYSGINGIRNTNILFKFFGIISILFGFFIFFYISWLNAIVSSLSLCWIISIYIIYITNKHIAYYYDNNKKLIFTFSLFIGIIFACINILSVIITYHYIYILYGLYILLYTVCFILISKYKALHELKLNLSFISHWIMRIEPVLSFLIPVFVLPLIIIIFILFGLGGLSLLFLKGFTTRERIL